METQKTSDSIVAAIKWVVIGAIVSTALLTRCGYELKSDGRGRTVRLDKWTGEISLLDGDTIVSPKTTEEATAEKEQLEAKEREEENARKIAKAALAEVSKRGEFKLDDVTASCQTVWRNGTMHYRIDVDGASDLLNRLQLSSGSQVTAEVLDKNNFILLRTSSLRMYSFTPIEEKGKTCQLTFQGELNCSEEKYREIAGQHIDLNRLLCRMLHLRKIHEKDFTEELRSDEATLPPRTTCTERHPALVLACASSPRNECIASPQRNLGCDICDCSY